MIPFQKGQLVGNSEMEHLNFFFSVLHNNLLVVIIKKNILKQAPFMVTIFTSKFALNVTKI